MITVVMVVMVSSGGNGGGRRSRACITSCSLGSASSRLGIDRLCEDHMATRHSYKLARLRRLSPLTWRPWAVTWSCHPLTDIAPPPMQRGPSVRTRPPQGIYDAATNPSSSPSLSLFLCLSLSLFLSFLPSLFSSSVSRRLSFPTVLSLSLPAFSSSETA